MSVSEYSANNCNIFSLRYDDRDYTEGQALHIFAGIKLSAFRMEYLFLGQRDR